ncbi:MAG: GGDEF domain-containing protein [Rhizobiales bacterium]|nr:GGDEF domain-containing protein [Hyphomicrobiales bacterium]
MSQQGPILIVSNGNRSPFADAIAQLKIFPLVESVWADAGDAVARLHPAAILAGYLDANGPALEKLGRQVSAVKPYTPLIALDPKSALPANIIPFAQSGDDTRRLIARLKAALRVRTEHATLLRRMTEPAARSIPQGDPLHDAMSLLIGRGGSFPTLSVALGQQMGVVGALSIEAAAKHLNARDLDGIVIGEGFSGRVVDAFLTVLSEDARFRNLPVLMAPTGVVGSSYDLPNLEICDADMLAQFAAPLIRQHAFEARIQRALKSIDAGGLLDARTGLLTSQAFARDLSAAIAENLERGAGFTLARIAFGQSSERMQFDAARVIGRLMRRMDFATLEDSGNILIVFAETGLRNAQLVARRFTSVLKHTLTSPDSAQRFEANVTLAALTAGDTADAMLSRLDQDAQRAAS